MRNKHTLSATNLASAHHLGCDLYLHHTYHGSDTPHTRQNQPSELSKAQFARGNDWESTLFNWLDDEGVLLTIRSSPLEADEIFEILQFDERDHFFIAGLSFRPPKNFAAEFLKAGAQPVAFGIAKPDLVEITRGEDGTITWKVIDAKASEAMKVFYLETFCVLDTDVVTNTLDQSYRTDLLLYDLFVSDVVRSVPLLREGGCLDSTTRWFPLIPPLTRAYQNSRSSSFF
jgi:hypothetical protein